MNRFLKILRRVFFSIIALLLVLYLAIQTETVQNWLIGFATNHLQNGLGTEVRIKKVNISLFNKVNLEGLLIRDKQKDTLVYASQMKVRLTDWFFLTNKIDLKYIGLEDAVIKLQRKDSVWNYQFIANYFASPKKSSNTTSNISIDLKKIDLKNVVFINNDEWRGEKLTAKVKSLLLDAHKMNFAKNLYEINDANIEEPYFSIDDFPELRPANIKKRDKALSALRDTGLQFNLGINFTIKHLQLKNGVFASTQDNDPPTKHFDGAHILLKQLTGNIDNFRFIDDTLTASINLSAKERSGFDLKKMKSRIKITPRMIELAKLDLQTNKSRLGDYYVMRFKHFNADFGKYMTNVLMDAKFKNSTVSSDDIAFFAPELASWKKQVFISGTFRGTVSNFTAQNMVLKSGTSTSIYGNLSMKGLPNVNNTLINFNNGSLVTNMTDVGIVVPAIRRIKEPNLAALGNIIFRGSFNGTLNNFTTNSVISTSLGGISNQFTLKTRQDGEPSYEGNIVTSRFNLGKFVNESSIGLVNFDGKIEGSGFALSKLKSSLNGKFSLFEFNGYPYTEIITKGTFQKKYFKGELKIDDPNVDFTSSLEIDFNNQIPKFNILGDLVKCDLQKINLTPKANYNLTGFFDINFSGNNIDNFLGSAKLLNANLTHNSTRLSFDSLVLNSEFINGEKLLTANSNEFTASVIGSNYQLLDLPIYFQWYLHKYFPAYFEAPATLPQNQDFTISFYTKQFDSYAQLIDKKLSGLDYCTFTGSINHQKNIFSVTANIPVVSYDNYHFSDIAINGKGGPDSLHINGDVTNIRIGDSINFPNTSFNIQSSNDHSLVKINTKAENTLNEVNVQADVFTLSDGVRIQMRPSTFLINDKQWNIDKNGELIIRKNFVSAENIKFTQGFQEIKIETDLGNEGGNTNTLIARLKNVFIGDITSIFMKNEKITGIANGEVKMNDFLGDFSAEANLTAEQFSYRNDSIGYLKINSAYDNKTGVVSYKVASPNDKYQFNADGYYNVKDTAGRPLAVNLQLENTKANLVEQFIGDIFSNVSGNVTGNLLISGNPNAPDLFGKLKLKNAGLLVNYTQVYYKIDSAFIKFDEDGIDFGAFTIYDMYKNSGTVKGKLYEKGFENMYFDFELNTNKLLLLNTQQKDNDRFYGKAIGKATMSFTGPESKAKMNIIAEANDSSHIYIPNSYSRESGDADFIIFKNYGTEVQASKPKSNFDLTVDVDITANNKVSIDVILDELTGDIIKANGNGRLKISAGTSSDVNIKGRYNIEKGAYNFNFQSFIKKPFKLLPESGNFIEWNGDPFKADLHIDALYEAENVSVSELISGQQSSVNSATKSYRGSVYVIAELRDKLNKPAISFKLDFPQSSPIKSDPVFTQFLSTIQTNQNEMLSQASSLIVFGTFAPYGQGLLSGNSSNTALTNYGVSTITQVLTNEVNKAVSNLLYKLTKDKSLKFDIGANVYSSSSIVGQNGGNIVANTNALDRSRLNFKIGKSFFDDKILVTFGGDLDFNVGATSTIANGNLQWLPDLNVEFILTKDRRLRAIAFSKNSLDINGNNLGRRNRQGVSLTYKKDFEKNPFEKQNTTINKSEAIIKEEEHTTPITNEKSSR